MRRSVTPRRRDSRRTGATPIAGRSRTGNGSRYRRMRRDDAQPSLPGLTHGCPVRFWLIRRMAWILLRFERLAASETREGAHAMLHQNSVFHSLLKHVPWSELEQIVEKYGSDELARELTTKRRLIALLYGQFSGATSLREIVTGLESHETRLYHLGAAPVKRSTMSDANSQRPWHVFAELATTMLMQETNDRGDNSHEGDRGDGPGCGNGRDDAGGAARAAGSDKRRRRSGSCVRIHLGGADLPLDRPRPPRP